MTDDGLVFLPDMNIDFDIYEVKDTDNKKYKLTVGPQVQPLYTPMPMNSYNTVNNDSKLRKKVVKYFYEQVDHWLYGSFRDLAGYFELVNGEPKPTQIKDSVQMTADKAKFLLDEVISKNTILILLDKYVRTRNVNWFDLKNKHYDAVKNYIHKKIRKHVVKMF